MRRLARHHGIALDYDGRKVPDRTLALILQGLGQDPQGDPVGPPAPQRMSVPGRTRCHVAPSLTEAPGWGVFCQLYELRSNRGWGIGDFADLAALARICGAAGADFLGVNPVHALFTALPERASPFSPSNRRFLNPLYIAPDLLGAERPAMQDGDHVDYPAVARAKLGALRRVFDSCRPDADFDDFVAQGGYALHQHALFEALSHHHGGGWQDWPVPFHDPHSAAVADFARRNRPDVQFHLWLQWIARQQLHAAQQAAKDAGMRVGLYLDLAVGEALDGSATWSGTAVSLPDLTIGAPPDMFSEDGQNWQLAAPSPVALRETDFAPYHAMIAAQLQDAGALRIDHAMALWQLFLIPRDAPAAAGTHLRFPLADMLRVLAEASQSHQALIIGEDLGFVPDGFRDSMQKAGVLSYRIVYFEKSAEGFAPAETYPQLALACLSTHDLPPLTGWWDGIDIDLREAHGLVSKATSRAHRDQRLEERKQLAHALGVAAPDADALLDAAHRFIAATPSVLAGVRLADLVGPARPTNLPGVTDGYPNWKLWSPVSIDQIAAHPRFARIARIMRHARPRPQ